MRDVRLEELHTNGELSTRTYRLLTNAGYQNLQELKALSSTELFHLRLGVQAIQELNELIKQYAEEGDEQKVILWDPEHVRAMDVSDLTEGRFATIGAMMDAFDTEYIGFADLCVVYRFLQEKCIPDHLLLRLRKRMMQEAPGWVMDMEINWDKVRPRLTRALKRESCETILDLIELEKREDIGFDSVERVEIRNLIDKALTEGKI